MSEKPSDDAWKNMEMALLPRTKDGLISPMEFFNPLPEEQNLLYPAFKPDADGCVRAMIFAPEFEDGKIPEDLEYIPGKKILSNNMFTGPDLDNIVYDDPLRNLSPYLYRSYIRGEQLLNENDLIMAPEGEEPRAKNSDKKEAARTTHKLGIMDNMDDDDGLLSNFDLIVKELRIILERNRPERKEVLIELVRANRKDYIVVGSEELDSIAGIVTKKFPDCIINADGKKSNAKIANYVRGQIHSVSTRTIIKSVGFQKIGGQWIYVHDGAQSPLPDVEFQTGYSIGCDLRCPQSKAIEYALGILEVSKKLDTILVLFLVAHLGPLYELFSAAGHEPRFVVFLNGTTGSLKTSVSLVLYRLFQQSSETPEASFVDTKTALEMKIGTACSRVLLIDDYQPAVTAASGKEKLEKLEHIVRLFGDGIGKARSTVNLERAKEVRPVGCCIVTGEDTGGSQSTLLRCLLLSVSRGDFDGNRLKIYQDYPERLQTHYSYFLKWCGEHGDEIVNYIKSSFQKEREFFSTDIKERRQADAGAILAITMEILLAYIKECNILPENEVCDCSERWRISLTAALKSSEDYSREMEPVAMYLRALFDLCAAGHIACSDGAKDFIPGKHKGYIKDGYWWLMDSEVYTMICRYWSDLGQRFPLTQKKLHEKLHMCKLIDVDVENRNGSERIKHLRRSSIEGRPYMLVLNIDLSRQYLYKTDGHN